MLSHLVFNRALAKVGADKRSNPGLFGRVFIDSRKCESRDIFLAFKGARCDGHDFVESLLKKGVICVGSRKMEGDNYFRVENVENFLTRLASEFRDVIDTRVVAVTGSSGKTSTRELITSMLKVSGKTVHATEGNLNNELGLPVTLLAKPLVADYTVLEMGMNHSGEIEKLCSIAKPQVSTITNIGTAHIGNFGSREELAGAKLEIFGGDYTRAVASSDDPFVKKWLEKNEFTGEIFTFGSEEENNLSVEKGADVKFRHLGSSGVWNLSKLPDFMRENFVTAAGVALSEGMDPVRIQKALEGYKLPPFRGESVVLGERKFTLDCYNANPDSMKKSVDSFLKEDGTTDDRFLVLGEMGELGGFSEHFHRELVNYIHFSTIATRVFLFGKEFKKLEKENKDISRFSFYTSIDELASALPKKGHFLLKGSRSNRLEKLIRILEVES